MKNVKQSEILELKAFLNTTDYLVMKKYEGYDVDENVLFERKLARKRINELEEEIKTLEEL